MTANEARELVSRKWTSWRRLEISMIDSLPKEYGVYIIRSKREIARLKGISDILYVGEGLLNGRLGKVFNFKLDYRSWPYESGEICRIEKELQIPMEFSYLIISDKDACQTNETKILDEYERQHIELPPVNHSRGRYSALDY